MKAEVITIGDELLIGQTVDTNSAWIGGELSRVGFDITRKTSIHDKRDDIMNALEESMHRKPDIVIITGGLGPTSDDITKQTLCDFFNTQLVLDHEVLEMIEDMMKRRGFPMNENNRRQAEVPESCRVLKNETGSAPGMWFKKEGINFISLPGVPYEMRHIMNLHVLPELNKQYVSQTVIHRNIMTYGEPEARLAEILSGFEASLPPNIKLAYLPSYGIIKLRLTGIGQDRNSLEKLIEDQVSKLYEIIPLLIYGENEDSLETVVGNLLKDKGLTISTAESCTGGKIAHMLTSIPGSSLYYRGSVIAYDNRVKIDLLGVPAIILEKYGAVSEEVIKMMAKGVRELIKTDFSVATSGIAGPDGGTASKPVGTLWIAVSSAKGTIAEKYTYGSDRLININRFSISALNLVRKQIISR
ncbi:MAG: competence/damage-inducible protein A [Bacteroidales bacterium]|nr:competence/damage-inducible protein A [Bacteroidales bacterium]